MFAEFRESRYVKKFVLSGSLDILEHKRLQAIHHVIFPDNPLMLVCWNSKWYGVLNLEILLSAISRELIVEVVEEYDMEEGKVSYKNPKEGSAHTFLDIWRAGAVAQLVLFIRCRHCHIP